MQAEVDGLVGREVDRQELADGTAEVVPRLGEAGDGRGRRAGVERRLVAVMPVVGRERQVDAAVGHDLVDRLVDDPVLIGRLGEVGEIVEDDPRACGGKREDVVREVRLAAESGREGERGAGSDVVDDLQHRPAFVGVGRGGAFG